jgi:hypothetical protein
VGALAIVEREAGVEVPLQLVYVTTGDIYDVTYTSAAKTVSIAFIGTLGVELPTSRSAGLQVLGNPARGSVRFAVSPSSGAELEVEVFDLSGRRVGVVPVLAGIGGGAAGAVWDSREGGSGPGVFFARLKGSQEAVVRFVVLR